MCTARALGTLLCALSLSAAAHAGEPAHQQVRWWGVREGLPSNRITALTQAADGYLWVGTAQGLARFDGARFVVVEPAHVSALLEGRDGELWIGTEGDGLVRRHRSGAIRRWNVREGLPHHYVRALAQDADGVLWIGTGEWLGRLEGERVQGVKIPSSSPSRQARAVAVDRNGRLWVALRAGLFTVERDVAVLDEQGPRTTIRKLLATPDGALWAAPLGGGLWRWRDHRWRQFGRADGLVHDDVMALAADRQGRVCAGTAAGTVDCFEGERFVSRVSAPAGLAVRALLEDREGNLWVGTDGGGLARVSRPPFALLGAMQGLPSGSPSAVHGGSDGVPWVVVGGSLARGDRFAVAPQDKRGQDPVVSIFALSAEDGWILRESGKLERRQGDRRQFTDTGVAPARAVTVDGAGRVWVAGAALARVTGDDVVRTELRRPATVMHVGARGGLFVGGESWLWQQAGERFTPRPNTKSLMDVLEDPQGRLWLASGARGLLLMTQTSSVEALGRRRGLPSDTVLSLLLGADGRLWMSTTEGICAVPADAIANPRGRPAVSCFSAHDGVTSLDERPSGHPASWRAPDGRLWFPTRSGLAVIDPKRVAPATPPPVLIEEVAVDGERLALGTPVSLPPRQGHLEVHYTAIALSAPEQLRFRYRLDGHDEAWVEAGAARVARYRVPPGRYQFRVSAALADGPWNEATFSFSIRPPFHRTPVFFVLIGGLVLAAALAVHRLRVARLRVRYEGVMEERARIAREIHDSLAQGFTALSVQLECVGEALGGGADGAQRELARARQLVTWSLGEARRAVTGLRTGGDLASSLRDLARRSSVDLKINGEPRELPGATAHELMRIAQEAVTNAQRHANGRDVVIELVFGPSEIRLVVRDDGQGFAVDDARAGFGLRGMRERAAGIGARLTIESAPGRTEIRVEVNT